MKKIKYKISSRTAILLGRESVSKVDGAIIELIKNTYDADADICFIYFDLQNDTIFILDNGIGMTMDTIENNWMMIGTDNKKNEFISDKNRIKSGEKGIGRFALDRLGSKCEMYTKNRNEQLLTWRTDWSEFEKEGKTLDEVEAELYYSEESLSDKIPKAILDSINDLENSKKDKEIDVNLDLQTGTLLKISSLRDRWSTKEIDKIYSSLGFLIPPSEQKKFVLCMQQSESLEYQVLENELGSEFDYKVKAVFDGTEFSITLFRNEFDLKLIPDAIFEMEEFSHSPFCKEDFEEEFLKFKFNISELMTSDDKELIDDVKRIGAFEFNFIFMKLQSSEDNRDIFYYKPVSKNRRKWLNQYGGVKIYRDNFLVRPYGDSLSDSFDWLGLDARTAKNPEGVANKSGNWGVINKQVQGTLFISRVENEVISDKSSREGIIENDYFDLLKNVLVNIISIFETDRAYIARNFKAYYDIVNVKEKTKEDGKKIARDILNKESVETNDMNDSMQGSEENDIIVKDTLAKTVEILESEKIELISEIKLLRSLATNGLITTAIIHDLKTINGSLETRSDDILRLIKGKHAKLLIENLDVLKLNDKFLLSWITVLTNQTKVDKRRRTKNSMGMVLTTVVETLRPIFEQRRIEVTFPNQEIDIVKKMFVADFESIFHNLLINSIEAFEKSTVTNKQIQIEIVEEEKSFKIIYKDNGPGIGGKYKNPYDIFKYSTTSKIDKEGNVIGTGLGMYIVASTAREYNAEVTLLNLEAIGKKIMGIPSLNTGFGIEINVPL